LNSRWNGGSRRNGPTMYDGLPVRRCGNTLPGILTRRKIDLEGNRNNLLHPAVTKAMDSLVYVTSREWVWTMRYREILLLLVVVSAHAGCQLGGFSAGVSSDPVGPTFDTSSLPPPGAGRTGQAYGKSGRARLRASAETAQGSNDSAAPPRRPRTLESTATASLGDDVAGGEESPDQSAPTSRALPVSAEEPEVLGRSPRPQPVRTIPVEE
jgi:hypothetical protein